MRHKIAGRKLGRNTSHRKAMWRNMAVSLFTHGQITTTVPKAKSLKPFVEKLITAAKKGDLASRRRVIAALGSNRIMIRSEDDENVPRNKYGEISKVERKAAPKVVKHLFEEIAPKFADRNGGYTRIVKLGKHRIGDGADLCVIMLVGDEDTGPQVGGQLSRRRDKANKRMEFAAKLRKADAKEEAPVVEAEAEAKEEKE
ncbi:50S ribosomal protein L17 [Planctomycetota bacterium]|nr:50S ribosomal protein L17 [Planctomycetota bacterium]